MREVELNQSEQTDNTPQRKIEKRRGDIATFFRHISKGLFKRKALESKAPEVLPSKMMVLKIGDQLIDLQTLDHIPKVNLPGQEGREVMIFTNDTTVWLAAYPFNLKAEMDIRGKEHVLTLDLRTKSKLGERLEGFPSGKEFVDAAIAFIESKTGSLTTFEAKWLSDGSSNNYATYMQKRNEGYSKREAAFATWSGSTVAQRHGFTKSNSIKKDRDGNMIVVFKKR